MKLTIEQLRTALRYNPETGEILRAPHWKPVALTAKGNGYACVEVGGQRYSARRLVWALVTGEWPPEGQYGVRLRDETLGLRWANLYLNTGERKCSRCSMVLPMTEFHVRSKTKANNIRYSSYCKDCTSTTSKLNAQKTTCKKYGLTVTQYESMLAEQGGGCAICGTKPDGKRLAIDHCHKTGEVRGLLCSPCNVGLGHFRDDTDLLYKAVKYLK